MNRISGGCGGEAKIGGGFGAVLGGDSERAAAAAGVCQRDAVAGGIDGSGEFGSAGGVDGVDDVTDGFSAVEGDIDLRAVAGGYGEVVLCCADGGDAVAVVKLGECCVCADEVDVGAGDGVGGGGDGDAEGCRGGSAVEILNGQCAGATALVGDDEALVGDGGVDADADGVVELIDYVVECDVVGCIDDGGIAAGVCDAELSGRNARAAVELGEGRL